MNILVRSFVEDGYQPIPSIRLSDDEYGRGLQCFVPACVDIIPIDIDRKVIYLARRTSKPMTGWWWIGGKIAPDESKEEAAARNFKRETELEVPQSRLQLVAVFDYRWKDRAQSPQEIGCHTLGYTFTVELTAVEMIYVSANLEKEEYEEGGDWLFRFRSRATGQRRSFSGHYRSLRPHIQQISFREFVKADSFFLFQK